MNDNYTAASGETIYAGMVAPEAVPSWVSAQAVNTWGTVPATNLLSDMNPKDDPAINPTFPSAPEWNGSTGFSSLAIAYCGYEWDYIKKRLRTTLGGGHQDYGGNDEYGIDLNTNQPAWFRMRAPSGAIGNVLTTNDGQEASGVYTDGMPRATHSYNKSVFVPSIGLIMAMHGSTWFSGQAGMSWPVYFDADGNFIKYGSTNTAGITSSGGGGCYDPSRHCLYFRGSGTAKLQKYDLSTEQWSQIGVTLAIPGGAAGYFSLEYMPESDCILIINSSFASGFAVFDPVTNQYHYPSVTGSPVGTSLTGFGRARRVGAGEYAFWDNTSNTTQITRLRFSGDPRAATWTLDQYPVAPTNAITPTVKAATGTYGKFFVDSDLGIMGLQNNVNQPIYFYRYK